MDIKTVNVQSLRKNISILLQEPVLFSGTVRFNLDPFGVYHDDELWRSLQEVGLVNIKEETSTANTTNDTSGNQHKQKFEIQSLDYEIQSCGKNLSVGQRQLLCLARSILRKNNILVLDEATANVDPTTDDLIQTTIKKKFKNCTVLIVAHRLNTVIDCHRILVLKNGRVVEFDDPYRLLMKEDGYFRNMVKETGASMEEHLTTKAFEMYSRKFEEID